MTKKEIRAYFHKLGAFQKRDFYNSIACRFGSSDDMIHLNNSEFFETQFLNKQDAEQSKSNNSYNQKHTYVRMLEYKKLETSNNLLDLIELETMKEIIFVNLDEVKEMGIINSLLTNKKIKSERE